MDLVIVVGTYDSFASASTLLNADIVGRSQNTLSSNGRLGSSASTGSTVLLNDGISSLGTGVK